MNDSSRWNNLHMFLIDMYHESLRQNQNADKSELRTRARKRDERISLSLTKPKFIHFHHESWTHDKLQNYFHQLPQIDVDGRRKGNHRDPLSATIHIKFGLNVLPFPFDLQQLLPKTMEIPRCLSEENFACFCRVKFIMDDEDFDFQIDS